MNILVGIFLSYHVKDLFMPDSKIPSQGHSQFTQFSSPTTPGYEFRAETDEGNLLRIKLQP